MDAPHAFPKSNIPDRAPIAVAAIFFVAIILRV
jgi:hypothetical protein